MQKYIWLIDWYWHWWWENKTFGIGLELKPKLRLVLVFVLKCNTNQDKSWYWSSWTIKTYLGIGIERNQKSRHVLVLVSNKMGGLAELCRRAEDNRWQLWVTLLLLLLLKHLPQGRTNLVFGCCRCYTIL